MLKECCDSSLESATGIKRIGANQRPSDDVTRAGEVKGWRGGTNTGNYAAGGAAFNLTEPIADDFSFFAN